MLVAKPKSENSIERDYAEGMEKIKMLFDKFRRKGSKDSFIQIVRADAERVTSINGKRTKRVPPIALPVILPYYSEDIGAVTVRYSSSPPTKDSGGRLVYGTKYIPFEETLSISEKDKDLAWFLIIASKLTERGVYKMVDREATYEGSFEELLIKKEANDLLLGKDEQLVRYIGMGIPEIGSTVEIMTYFEVVSRVSQWLEAENKKPIERYKQVVELANKYRKEATASKQRMSSIEFDGEEVEIQPAPDGVTRNSLVAEAKGLGIKITMPPQSNDVLYSLIQHVKAKVTA